VSDLRDRIAQLAASIAAGRAPAPGVAGDWRDWATRTAVLVDAARGGW